MRLEFKPQAFEDLQYWVATQPKIAKRLMRLLKETMRYPFGGIGKPEPLKGELAGWWSKRIDGEHRLVYKVEGAGEVELLRDGGEGVGVLGDHVSGGVEAGATDEARGGEPGGCRELAPEEGLAEPGFGGQPRLRLEPSRLVGPVPRFKAS